MGVAGPARGSVELEALGLLEAAFQNFERIAVSFSGAEDVVLIDLGTRILGSDLPVFSLDTGRLHPETHRFMETVREHYGVAIETLAPDPDEVAR
ncbi:MAG: phosphoadenosine phosphosulfate reductase family protein, partial [Gammaproteobacteria bacterium]|nr:phosphoadenosine phosphosulfate reductase family protein [Gammaproteobacteria bacterium]